MLFGLTKMNLKNTLENLVIAIAVFFVGAFVGHKLTKVTSEAVVEILKPTIDKAIDKDTVENSIYNAINNNFEKIKKSDSLKIVIEQEPYNDNNPNTIIDDNCECIVNKTQYDKLSESKRKRLMRWLDL